MDRIYDFSCHCLKQSIGLAEKCEYYDFETQHYSANFSASLNGIGESYNRLAMFCQEYHGNHSPRESQEMERMFMISILRGMKHNSKNARLQFASILQLSNLKNGQLMETFNEEV